MRVRYWILSAMSAFLFVGCSTGAWKRATENIPLKLATAGKTDYVVAAPEAPTAVDNHALNALTEFMKKKTGAEFPVVSPDKIPPGKKRIFVGCPVGMTREKLKAQEYVVRNDGDDIVLYGEGLHGNFHAVVDFMENTLGRRWYAESDYVDTPRWDRVDSQPTFTVERELSINPFDRKGGFSFPIRMPSYTKLFHYHAGFNMGFDRRDGKFPPGVVSKLYQVGGVHNLFGYIPPSPEAQTRPNIFSWVPKQDYFKTNPEFFTMNQQGQRVVDQLCFGNPALRRELTKNVIENLRRVKATGESRLVASVTAMDNPGEFCFCPECQKLKRKYKCPGGPLFDYLFELCAMLKEKEPDVMAHTIAYRLTQTRKPPVMPDGMTFPDNLIIQFADVDDDADKDFNSPTNHSSYEDLLSWRKLTPHLWTWYYPYPPSMPCGNIERLVTDLRLMKKAGVEGVFYEFTSIDNPCGDNFTELQKYLYAKLLKDIDADVPALIKEFTDHQYGQAAPMVRTYLEELEREQKSACHDTSLASGKGYKRNLIFPAAALRRWQGYFDQMAEYAATDPRCLKNLRRLRRTLDFATLSRWVTLSAAFPDYFTDHMVVRKRLDPLPRFYAAMVEDYETMIKVADQEKTTAITVRLN